MDLLNFVKEKEARMIQIRRDLHQIPELELNLPKTMNYIEGVLDESGIKYTKLLNGNAIVAEIEGETPSNKCFAIRTDCDALPIKEDTGLPFASTNGCMHACGHDGHTAMALCAAMVLNEHRNLFSGKVKILFQPAEEIPGGALPMIQEGALDGVDCIIGCHEGILMDIPIGKIGLHKGALMASTDVFEIWIDGKNAHGAAPHLGVDPIVCASELVLALQSIHSREISPLDKMVMTIGMFQSGTAHNIIADSVYLKGTVRTLDEKLRQFVAKRIHELTENIAKSHRCTSRINYDFSYPVLVNDADFTQFVHDTIVENLGEDSVYWIENPTMGAEDMAYYLQKVPGTFYMLCNPRVHDDGTIYPHHHAKFDIDEALMHKSVVAFVACAIKYLSKE